MKHTNVRAFFALLASLALTVSMVSVVFAEHDTAGPAVTPTAEEFPGGDPVCPSDDGFRFGQDADAPLEDGSFGGVTIDLSEDGTTVDFTTDGTVLVAHVFVKGGAGNEQNHYDYSGFTGGGVAHDDGLTTPTGQEISHIDFCVVEVEEPTPTPTDEPTPTPTDEPTPTPTDEPTPPAPTPPPTSMSDGGTGSQPLLPVLLVGLMAAAWLLLRPTKRFSPVARKRSA